jgi:hypothetical protein
MRERMRSFRGNSTFKVRVLVNRDLLYLSRLFIIGVTSIFGLTEDSRRNQYARDSEIE